MVRSGSGGQLDHRNSQTPNIGFEVVTVNLDSILSKKRENNELAMKIYRASSFASHAAPNEDAGYAVRSTQIMANVSICKVNIMRQCIKVHLPPLASSWDAQSLVQGRLGGLTYKWSTLLYFNIICIFTYSLKLNQ